MRAMFFIFPTPNSFPLVRGLRENWGGEGRRGDKCGWVRKIRNRQTLPFSATSSRKDQHKVFREPLGSSMSAPSSYTSAPRGLFPEFLTPSIQAEGSGRAWEIRPKQFKFMLMTSALLSCKEKFAREAPIGNKSVTKLIQEGPNSVLQLFIQDPPDRGQSRTIRFSKFPGSGLKKI